MDVEPGFNARLAAGHRRIPGNAFERAAWRLMHRFYRRHPQSGRYHDVQTIKDRWYRRGTCQYARTLGA